jgi:hypothetical protein
VSEKPCTPRKVSWTNRGVPREMHTGRSERSAWGQDGSDNLARQAASLGRCDALAPVRMHHYCRCKAAKPSTPDFNERREWRLFIYPARRRARQRRIRSAEPVRTAPVVSIVCSTIAMLA